MKHFFETWWPTSLTVAVILYATLAPDPVGADELPKIPYVDKLVHAVMFGGLFGALCFDRRRSGALLSRTPLLCFAAAAMAFGCLDEVAQGTLTDGRSAEAADFVADCLGVAIAAASAPPVVNRIFRKKTPIKR